MAKQTTLQFGRRRPSSPPSHHTANRKPSAAPNAELVLLCGVMTAAVFFIGTLSGASLSEDAARVEGTLDAIPVMSGAVEESTEDTAAFSSTEVLTDGEKVREILRKNIRDASGEPFGYMGGRWNLWEYLGDVMAELLVGG